MPEETVERETPSIELVQHNVENAKHQFEGVEPVDSEYIEDFAHSGESVRLVLSNGNWVEYHRRGDETVVECAFLTDESDSEPVALLENRLKLHNRDVGSTAAFFDTVDTSIEVYQTEIETVADAEKLWANIVPALEK